MIVCAISIPYFGNLKKVDTIRDEAVEEAKLGPKLTQLAIEFCPQSKLSEDDCGEAVELLKLKAADSKTTQRDFEKSFNQYFKKKSFTPKETVASAERIAQFIGKISKSVETDDADLRSLEGFSDLKTAYDEIQGKLLTAYRENNVLTSKTKTLKRLMLAQSTHGGWGHLLGNLLFFIVFGMVIEARMGSLAFAGVYLIGGTFGLLLELAMSKGAAVPLLGASANISAVIGAFLVFYFHRPMKVLGSVIVYNKIIEVPTWMMVGIFILFNDLAGVIGEAGGVAHLAHLTGFALGALAAYVMKAYDGLGADYLYPVEYDWHLELKRANTLTAKIEIANRILKTNPECDPVLRDVYRSIAEAPTVSQDGRDFLKRTFAPALLRLFKKRDSIRFAESLDRHPSQLSLIASLKGLTARQTLVMQQSELKKGRWLSALRFADALRTHYPKSSTGLNETMERVLEHLRAQNEDLSSLETYLNSEPNSTYAIVLQNYVQVRDQYGRAS